MKQVILGLGGNVGNTSMFLNAAIEKINLQIGNTTLQSSRYETAAWGVENQPNFINMVLVLHTKQPAQEVLTCCLSIEKELGRDRGGKKWSERTIDIDLLFYQNEIIKTDSLIVPHPYIQERNFVLFPLAEILPKVVHPILKKTFLALKNESKDKQKISLLIA